MNLLNWLNIFASYRDAHDDTKYLIDLKKYPNLLRNAPDSTQDVAITLKTLAQEAHALGYDYLGIIL